MGRFIRLGTNWMDVSRSIVEGKSLAVIEALHTQWNNAVLLMLLLRLTLKVL
jgi:hypothetical protein